MKKILPVALLLLASCVVYAPAIWNGFVWDDTALILRDPLIRSWRLIPEGFQHFLFIDATASDFYRPIQRLTYTFDYAMAGFHPAFYHLASIGYHALATIGFFLFAHELLRRFELAQQSRVIAAFSAALLWTIHPCLTSAVIYVSGRADSLAALFGFFGLFFALRARGWMTNVVAGLLLLLSALSKESGLIFLAALFAILFAEKKWKSILRSALTNAFVLVIYGVLRFSAEHTPAPSPQPLPLLVRPILFARAVAEYAGLLIFPLHLHMDRDVETHPFGLSSASMTASAWRELETIAGLLLIAGFVFWMLRARKHDRAIFISLLLAALTYLPISGVLPLNATIAEHWLYLPAAFLFLALTLSVKRWNTLTISVAILCLLLLSARTFLRCYDWKDQRTFLEHTIADGGDSARMLINLGSFESSEGQLDPARKHLEMALQKEPEQPFGIITLAGVAVKQNDFKTAHGLLARATAMPLVEAQAHELLAILENKETGHVNLLRLRLASRTGAPNWSIEKRYVRLLDEVGGTEAAIAELKHSLETQWYRAESWQLLRELLAKSNRNEEAAEAQATARRYDVRLAASTALVSEAR